VLTRFNAILGTLMVLVLATGYWQDATFGIVMIANSLFGIVQETRAKRKLDRLAVLSAPKAAPGTLRQWCRGRPTGECAVHRPQ